MLRTLLIQIVVTIILLLLGVLLLEGGAAILRGGQARASLTVTAYQKLFANRAVATSANRSTSNRKGGKRQTKSESKNNGVPEFLTQDYLTDEDSIERLFPALQSDRVVLGNSPYKNLATDDARVTLDDPELCRVMKPNLVVETALMRSLILRPTDPITYSIRPADKEKASRETLAFLNRYAWKPTFIHIDSVGQRVTVPQVSATNSVLVIGDSVAFGVGLNDDETIASRLQQRESDVRFINAGVPSVDSTANLARLERYLRNSGTSIQGVVYVHCENDFGEDDEEITPAREPERVVDALVAELDKANVRFRVFVYQQHMCRTMPDIFRKATPRDHYSLKERMIRHASERGLVVVDFYDLVQDYRRDAGAPMAGAALYVDDCHFSRLGTEELVKRIPRFGTENTAAPAR